MSDVTAQAFREAAARYTASDFRYAAQTYMADANLRALLLAAAEQREQLDDLQRKYDNTRQWGLDANRWIQECDPFLKDGERPAECIARNRADIDALLKQIATLTAEYGAVLLKLDACRGEAAKERHTLTAERDAARTLARQAANGWACYATRAAEHDEIAEIHAALDALTRPA